MTPGTRLGPYEILDALGRGGMGEVYRARDTRLDRIVAIKVLPPAFANDPDRLHRFQQEARAIAALNHAHICHIYDVGPDHLVLEYVEGRTLHGPLPPKPALRLALQIVDALQAAHERGILHRDLKPANILVQAARSGAGRAAPQDDDGNVKIIDFGLASLANDEADATRTVAGTVVGTAAYMSPEQADGSPVDQRSDIFSLGAVLYELLSGRRAFDGATAATALSAVLRDDPPPLPASVPPPLERIVMRCLAKKAADRYQNVGDLKAALEHTSTKAAAEQPSIAVLPFANMSADKENEYFSDGLAEEIINALAHIPGLTVIARTSAFAFKGKQDDVRRIAEALDVTNILEGSVRRSGNRIRVTAQLVTASNGSHLWSERYDREMADVFAIQDEIAGAIAEALQVRLELPSHAKRGGTRNLAAYEAFLKGRYHWAKLSPESLERSREFYEEAIRLDPGFALASSFLAEHFFAMAVSHVGDPRELMPKARAGAREAVKIDPSLPEAQALLGSIAGIYDFDWAEAAACFRVAMARQPATPHTRLHYGYHLAITGQLEASRRQYEQAVAEDPLHMLYRSHLAACLLAMGAVDEAIAVLRKGLEIEPTVWLLTMLGHTLGLAGALPEAIAHAERAYQLFPWQGTAVGLLAALLSRTGDGGRSSELLATLEMAPAARRTAAMVTYHSVRHEPDAAADWAEQAIAVREPNIPLIVRLNLAQAHPRWIALARMLKFPDLVEKA